MLGVKSRWQSGGRDAAELAFTKFRNLCAISLAAETTADIQEAVIESDSFAAVCSSPKVAVRIAQRLYRQAFESHEKQEERVWLRGVIHGVQEVTALRSSGPLSVSLASVTVFTYASALLDAINVEKSGIKGMRLLVDDRLISDSLTRDFSIRIEGRAISRFSNLKHVGYPTRVDGFYQDFLWMALPSDADRKHYALIAASSLRKSVKNAEEFAQAAATQVLFHECMAIVGQVAKSQKRKLEGFRT